ncbi:MAG TPA: PAS domain S-box protein [Kofleriaceae bacterium]|nr:PAS domain S-box protein [Kofleriaceae bacterium]
MSTSDTDSREHASELHRDITPIRDDAGKLVGFAKVTRDLTERETAEEQRRNDNERFRLLVESVQDYAIFILDPEGNVATWNSGAERFKGYRAAEIIGKHFSTFYPAEDVRAGKCEMELEGATRTGRYEDEGWRVRKDGTRFWANVVITALRDPSGTLLGFGKVTRDLTERKRGEEDHRVADERFRLLVDSVQDYAIFILDPNGNVTTWNSGAEHIKGYSANEVIGTHFSRFYPPADVRAGKCERELEGATRDGRYEDEGWRVRKDGSMFWANVVISAIRDDLGTLVGFSKITRDLTERRRNEEDRRARAIAEQANKTKDEFLAMLGHELRNPLAPIVSALQLLKLRGDTRSLREHQIIERQVRQMVRLVDDLLDISRISRGKIELQRAKTDIRDALAKAAEIAIPLFEKKSQTFEVDTLQEPLLVDGDEARLIQVFANLLNNSAKYTPEGGGITMSVRKVADELFVEVRDDGIGMDPALLPRIFELFVQGYQDVDRPEGGLGVGLTLVRSLVELHGGRVEAHSAGRNKGSTFTVRLPLAKQEPSRDPASLLSSAFGSVVARQSHKHRVLVVDDNEDALVLLADILAAVGYDVRTAGDGPSALEVMNGFEPHCALLDIGLPGMDGYELASRIRQAPGGDKIRLVALSGYGQSADHQRTEHAGFDAHLVKPVEVQRVLEQLAKLPPS